MRRWRTLRHPLSSSPIGPTAARGTSPSGCAGRRRRVCQLRPGDRPVLDDRGAGVLPGRSDRAGVPARSVPHHCWACSGPSRRSPRRSARARATPGTSTTRTCSSAARRSPPGYVAHLVPNWIPALDRWAKLNAGARVADVGCRLGASSVILAEAYPAVPGDGFGLPRCVDRVCTQAGRRRGGGRPGELARSPAQTFSGTHYDLVTTFDCLHDTGDPVGAARHIRQALAPHGTWLVVEPAAGDRVEDNPQPRGPATTAPRRSCACPMACPNPVATRSARKPVRPPFAGSSPTPDSLGSAASPPLRSTRSTRFDTDAMGSTPRGWMKWVPTTQPSVSRRPPPLITR